MKVTEEITVYKSFCMLKYCLGLDVSSKELYACLSVIDHLQKVTVKCSSKFLNNPTGFESQREVKKLSLYDDEKV